MAAIAVSGGSTAGAATGRHGPALQSTTVVSAKLWPLRISLTSVFMIEVLPIEIIGCQGQSRRLINSSVRRTKTVDLNAPGVRTDLRTFRADGRKPPIR